MNTQSVTGRMLQSLSSTKDDLVHSYLQAFGIKNVKSVKLPPVFKDKYLPEWQAFTREFGLKLPNPTAEKAALYRVLEFVRYMKVMGLNPLAKTFQHPRQAKIETRGLNPANVYERILLADLIDNALAISSALKDNQLLLLFKILKSKSDVALNSGDMVLTTSFVLVPRRAADQIDNLLNNLRGPLYSDSKVPTQLRERRQVLPKTSRVKAKVLNGKANDLMVSNSSIGWLPLVKKRGYAMHLIRAREGQLVLKVQVAVNLDVNFGASTKKLVLRLWAKAFKSI